MKINSPNVPHAQTFDVLAMRSGWAKTDQHLVLDGTSGGSHAHEDANAILMLTQDDRFLLLSPDRLYNTGPRDHNMVTVSRNGLGASLPSFARLDTKADLPTFGFTVTTMCDHVGADWTRIILWLRGDFFLVVDRVEARTRADYSATCRWFGLGEPELADGVCVYHQSEWEGSRTDFVVHNLSGADLRTRVLPYGAPATWESGYDPKLGPLLRTDCTNLTELDQLQNATLEAGDAIVIANLLYARSGPRVNERLAVRMGWNDWLLVETPAGPYALHVAAGEGARLRDSGIETTCRALVAGPDVVAAVGCTAIRIGHLSIQFSMPCGIEVSAAGSVTVDAPAHLSAIWRQGRECRELEIAPGRQELDVGDLILALPDPRSIVTGRASALQHSRADVEPSFRSSAPAWTTRLPSKINALHAASFAGEELLLAGCEDGTLMALDPDGSKVWRHSAPGPVNAVHSGPLRAAEPARIVIGTENEFTIAIDSKTRDEVWRHRAEFGQQFWPSWAWHNASVMRVHVDDLDGDGNGEVVLTSGNMHLLLLDAEGRERWRFRTDHGLFLTSAVIDLDGDGHKEIVGGTDMLSSSSVCRVIGDDGIQRHTFENAGWTSQLKDVLIDDLDGDGELEIVNAVTQGENLRVHRLGSHERVWGQHLGETPTGLAALDGAGGGKVLLAVTDGPTAVAFGPRGDVLWTVDVSPGADGVVRLDGTAAVIGSDGRIVHVRGDATVMPLGYVDYDVSATTCYNGCIVAGGGDGSLTAFKTAAREGAAPGEPMGFRH